MTIESAFLLESLTKMRKRQRKPRSAKIRFVRLLMRRGGGDGEGEEE